jgi:hypothetical protein
MTPRRDMYHIYSVWAGAKYAVIMNETSTNK